VKYLPIATILVKTTIPNGLCGPKAQSALKEALKYGALLTEVASGALSDYEAKKNTIDTHVKLIRSIHKYQRICPVRVAKAPYATNANDISVPRC
jgi:hypothetical protein